MTQPTTGTERATERAESTVGRKAESIAHGTSGSDGGHAREGNVNSGGQGLKGKVGDAVGGGLHVGAAGQRYTDGVVRRNPYFQSGTVETAGYGGPPNIGAVTPVFDSARHDALVLAGQIVDDTTGNAGAQAGGVGSGLAPELVTLPPLTGKDARDAAKASVDAAAAYQGSHPVMLHGQSVETFAAAQEADDWGNPLDPEAAAIAGMPVGGTVDENGDPTGSGSTEGDYDDRSSRVGNREQSSTSEVHNERATGEQAASGETSRASAPGPAAPRSRVDPTRSSGSQQTSQGQSSSATSGESSGSQG